MRYGSRVGGLALAILAGAGWTAGAGSQDPGQAVFTGKGSCFTCHGRDASGTPLAPDLTDADWVSFAEPPTLEEVVALVKAGVERPVRYPAPMPPMGGAALSDAEVTAVAGYVLRLSRGGS